MTLSVSRLRCVSSWRQVLPMLMFVAFALQSYVTQTHIHVAGYVATGGIGFVDEDQGPMTGNVAAKSGEHDRHSPADDPANCPICQEMLYAGHYVIPVAVAILLPFVAVSTVTIVEAIPLRIFAPSHNWQGRAPPQV